VSEERDCPQQILIGSMNTKYCVLLGLSLFLEQWIRDGDGATSQWLFCDGTTDETSTTKQQNNEAKKANGKFRNILKTIIDSDTFIRDPSKGRLGSHSIRKIAATMCRQRGVPKDDIDYRGKWKLKRMQDRYTNIQLDWPDVNAASKLCDGGPVLYKPKDGSGITDEWLAREVAPGISTSFGVAVGAILAKSLLWACFEPSTIELVPSSILNRAVSKFILLESPIADGVNPIERVEVIASEFGGTINLDEIPNEVPEGATATATAIPGGVGGGGGDRMSQQWRNAIYAKVSNIQTNVTAMQNLNIAKFATLERRLRLSENILRGLSVSPSRRRMIRNNNEATAAPLGTAPPVEPLATLHSCPRTLELLWDEYQNGIGGRKPAREFTRSERGKVKFKYSRRLLFWKCMERLLNRGNTVSTAIRKIHDIYGYTTVTKLIEKLRRDERNGGHNRLR
jgi:hypothetical protein